MWPVLKTPVLKTLHSGAQARRHSTSGQEQKRQSPAWAVQSQQSSSSCHKPAGPPPLRCPSLTQASGWTSVQPLGSNISVAATISRDRVRHTAFPPYQSFHGRATGSIRVTAPARALRLCAASTPRAPPRRWRSTCGEDRARVNASC